MKKAYIPAEIFIKEIEVTKVMTGSDNYFNTELLEGTQES